MRTPKERPILFKGEMVRAILDGRKTQTRRICKGARELSCALDWPIDSCPYGSPGDRLWVRETWMDLSPYEETDVKRAIYKATFGNVPSGDRWKPSIHMPRWASRITLEITEVRVQRLQEISDSDCEAEGVRPSVDGNANDWLPDETGWRRTYRQLWDSINSERGFSWDSNPYVWAISFKVIAPTPSAKGGEHE